MVSTFLPIFARNLEIGIGMIGLITAAQGIGAMLFNLPAGVMAGRFQGKQLILIGLGGMTGAALLRAFSSTASMLLLAGLVMGVFSSLEGIARLTYLRINLPAVQRGRFLAKIGGMVRVSRILSPVVGGLLIRYLGFRLIFLLHVGLMLLAILVVVLILPTGKQRHFNGSRVALGDVLRYSRSNSRKILMALFGINGLSMIRASRTLLIPIWADSLGIDITLIGIITSSSAVIETLLMFPAGMIMDRKGRKWAAVPCTFLLSLSVCLIPLSSGFFSLLAVSLLAGLGNGLGSGINMTISSDLAPDFAPGEFLGAWRFVTNSGTIAGSALVGYVAELFSLAIAPLVTGVFGIGIAVAIFFFMDESRQPQHVLDKKRA
jgi:MFS family permease